MKSVGAYLGCPTGSEVPDGRWVRKSSAVPGWNLTVFSKERAGRSLSLSPCGTPRNACVAAAVEAVHGCLMVGSI